MALQSPLNETDKQAMDDNLQLLKDLDEQIRIAEQAGVPVGDLKQQAITMRQNINKLKQAYFGRG